MSQILSQNYRVEEAYWIEDLALPDLKLSFANFKKCHDDIIVLADISKAILASKGIIFRSLQKSHGRQGGVQTKHFSEFSNDDLDLSISSKDRGVNLKIDVEVAENVHFGSGPYKGIKAAMDQV